MHAKPKIKGYFRLQKFKKDYPQSSYVSFAVPKNGITLQWNITKLATIFLIMLKQHSDLFTTKNTNQTQKQSNLYKITKQHKKKKRNLRLLLQLFMKTVQCPGLSLDWKKQEIILTLVVQLLKLEIGAKFHYLMEKWYAKRSQASISLFNHTPNNTNSR